MQSPIAIISQAFRIPSSENNHFDDDVLQNKSSISSVDPKRWSQDTFFNTNKNRPATSYTFKAGSIGDISQFDADFFRISPREASQMDPQQRLLLELSWECFENAGIRPSSMAGKPCGVYIGISSSDYSYRLLEDLGSIGSSAATGNTLSIAANRLSYFYDLRGPSMSIDTACSSSLVAFHQACQAIRSGEITAALTGGVSLHIHPYGFIIFSKASMLSTKGQCNVFDASGDGYVRSEGAGLFLLKNYDQAIADGDRIIGVVRHSSTNTDGKKSGLTVPKAETQAELLYNAYQQAGINPDHIDYIEAHGTGTVVGDPVETRALGLALGKHRQPNHPLLIGSVKSNLGHLEAASGVAGLIKSLFILENRLIPATIGIKQLNPHIDFDDLNLEVVTSNYPLSEKKQLIIGVNSFGFGGANAHIILTNHSAKTQQLTPSPAQHNRVPVVVTGASPSALKANAARISAMLLEQDADLYDVAYELAYRRDWLEYRAITFAQTATDAAIDLKAFADSLDESKVVSGVAGIHSKQPKQGPAFFYSGNGSQWQGMGIKLLESPVFLNAIKQIDRHFIKLAGYSIEDELRGLHGSGRYAHTNIAQPALFGIQVGLTAMLKAQGITPAAITGHSVGEVAAAWAAGILDLGAAVRVIYHRSRLQETAKGSGIMTAANLGKEKAQTILEQLNLIDQVSIAGINSHQGVTLAGSVAALESVERTLSTHDIYFKRLDIDYAFHSPAMDTFEAELLAALAHLEPKTGTTPFYSTVTGSLLSGTELTASYWWRNIREPVRFSEAAHAIIQSGVTSLLEIGPHPILKSYLNAALKETRQNDPEGKETGLSETDQDSSVVLHAYSKTSDTLHSVESATAKLLIVGEEINLRCYFPCTGKHIQLPNYCWQKERHWHAFSSESARSIERHFEHPLLGYRLNQHPLTWEQDLDAVGLEYLSDHIVGNSIVFPGTGFVELALAAAQLWLNEHTAQIENLDILTGIIQTGKNGNRLRVQIDPSDGRVTIMSREQFSDESWVTNATCRIISNANFPLINTLKVESDRPYDFDRNEHIALTQKVGLQYGSTFQAVEHGWCSENEITARLIVPSLIVHNLDAYRIHPALLDCSFQLIIHFLRKYLDESKGFTFIPTQIGKVTYIEKNKSAYRQDVIAVNHGLNVQTYHVQVTLIRKLPHSLVADFRLYDEQGQAVAVIEQARFRRVQVRSERQTPIKYVHTQYVPQPHAHTHVASRLIYEDILRTSNDVSRRIVHEKSFQTYVSELDPLLDILCAQFAHDAMVEMGMDRLNSDEFSNAIETLHMKHPQLKNYLNFLINVMKQDDLIHDNDEGIVLASREASQDAATALDILNSLLEDYPDHFGIIWATGRVGMHLTPLLKGDLSLENVLPVNTTTQSLLRLLIGNQASARFFESLIIHIKKLNLQRHANERIGVLEISSEHPQYLLDIADHVSTDHVDLSYITAHATAIPDLKCAIQGYPKVIIEALDEEDHEEYTFGSSPKADIGVVWLNFQTAAQNHLALTRASDRLKPGGVLAVIGQHNTRWIDFVLGADPARWSTQTDGKAPTAQYSREFWQSQLEYLGYSHVDTMETNRSIEIASGPYLLLGQKSESELIKISTETPTLRCWLILADQIKNTQAWEYGLTKELQEQGGLVIVSDQIETEAIIAQIDTIRQQFGELDGIIHLYSLGQDATKRCMVAANILKACQASQTKSSIWLITQSATLPNFDLGTQKNTTCISDAVLHGFSRSMANESLDNQVRLIDLPHGTPDAEITTMLIREISEISIETEVSLVRNGARFVPRLKLGKEDVHPNASAVNQVNERIYKRLEFNQPGNLSHLKWVNYTPKPLSKNEVAVEITATGLNFRDVMYTLGLLSDEAIENGFAGPTLGLEFAGIVTEVGSAVTEFQIGDSVVGFGSAGFSNRAVTQETALSIIPKGLSDEAAATIPSTFFTAYYALHYLARLSQGERVLIHGAAGGVGLAAIQVAKWCKAEIFATAGSPEKREFLNMMGVEHVLDSRSLQFSDEVMRLTDGQGVDVVLNSLSGEAIHRNLSVLKPFGRFLELGKRDFYENTRIGLRPFRNNITYYGIDADQLMNQRPALAASLFGEVINLFNQGILHALPYTQFEAREVVEAFRFMQQAQQIGKIIVSYRRGIPLNESSSAQRSDNDQQQALSISGDGTYLVTGGLGGFGLRTAQWLVQKGAKNIVLLSRSGPESKEARSVLESFTLSGINTRALACDVTDRDAMQMVLNEVQLNMPPLKGVIHAAAVIEDSLICNLSEQQLEKVLAPKILGALHLHELTRHAKLDFFVMYSSGTTLFGNGGQAAYVAANTWMESLAAIRQMQGLPATCMLWGAIDDVGFLARNQQTKTLLQQRMGGEALPAEKALSELEMAITENRNNLAILELNWQSLSKFLPTAHAPKFSELASALEGESLAQTDSNNVEHMLATLDDQELTTAFIVMIKGKVSEILRMSQDKIDIYKSIYDLGLDSLMGVELIMAIEAQFGIRLSMMSISEAQTIERLAARLITLLRQQRISHGSESDETTAQVNDFINKHAVDISQDDISDAVEKVVAARYQPVTRMIQ